MNTCAQKSQSHSDVVQSVKQFMETSTLGEYQMRLKMLFAFHCQMIHEDQSERQGTISTKRKNSLFCDESVFLRSWHLKTTVLQGSSWRRFGISINTTSNFFPMSKTGSKKLDNLLKSSWRYAIVQTVLWASPSLKKWPSFMHQWRITRYVLFASTGFCQNSKMERFQFLGSESGSGKNAQNSVQTRQRIRKGSQRLCAAFPDSGHQRLDNRRWWWCVGQIKHIRSQCGVLCGIRILEGNGIYGTSFVLQLFVSNCSKNESSFSESSLVSSFCSACTMNFPASSKAVIPFKLGYQHCSEGCENIANRPCSAGHTHS